MPPLIETSDDVTYLDVPEAHRGGLVLDVARGGRLRLSIGGEPLLFARQEPEMWGVHLLYVERDAPLGVVPPIRAAEMRDEKTRAQWGNEFGRRLAASTRSPLSAGRWSISPRFAPDGPHRGWMPPASFDLRAAPVWEVERPLPSTRIHYEDWGGSGASTILGLRPASPPDAGRVKALRKHARAGTLAPILLWDVTGLSAFVLLDGHDRLVAAHREGVPPMIFVLERHRDAERHPEHIVRAEHSYAQAFENEARLGQASVERLNRMLTFAHLDTEIGRTHARAWPGGEREWEAEVLRHGAGLDELDDLLQPLVGDAPRV